MADPFLIAGGNHGCLLIHGFTGSPDEMRGLGGHLASHGMTVLALRLPGHDATPEELSVVRWRDWLAAVEGAYAYLAERCTRVSLAGFSLGGALAILLAARHPTHRVALLATPMHLQGDWRVSLLAVARHTIPWFYPLEKADFRDPAVRAEVARHAPGLDLDDPAVQARIRREARISLHAVDELRMTLAAARAALPLVRTPTLVMQGCEDDVAPRDSPATIAARLGGPRTETVWWEQTGHQLLVQGPHRHAIYARIATFLTTTDEA
jgi:carboxylesterase